MEGDSREADDIELLRNANRGDRKAFHKLVDRHSDRLYRLAVSLVGNAADAEDILQETFVGAFKGLKGFQERASVKTWLTRILVTQTAKWRRDKKRRANPTVDSTLPSNEAFPAMLTVAPGVEGSVEARVDVHAAVAKLSAEHREVILLREFQQMNYDEIAEVLDVPRGTVESRLHRARAELKNILKAYLP